ncbi:MAG: rod shape-determining protein, partial [Actinomycetota bacterium]|nr:rod shape-determining protein [Actinomycetota bacterium]
VAAQSARVGGDVMDDSIAQYVKKEDSVALGDSTAEEVKVALGSAWPLTDEMYAEIRGRDLVTGLPKTVTVSSVEMREALEEPIGSIIDTVKFTLDQTPPELAADIMDQGITLAGGGALLRGLDQRLANETGMPIRITPDPLYAVARGSGQSLEVFEVLRGVLFSSGDQY